MKLSIRTRWVTCRTLTDPTETQKKELPLHGFINEKSCRGFRDSFEDHRPSNELHSSSPGIPSEGRREIMIIFLVGSIHHVVTIYERERNGS